MTNSKNEVAVHVDLIQESIDRLMGVAFPKSSSNVYRLAVNIAQGAHLYQEIVIEKKLVHLVAFEKNKRDTARALALIQHVAGWKGVQFFIDGKVALNTYNISGVLQCYMEACSCNDWRAHCLQTVDDYKASTSNSVAPAMIRIAITAEKPIKEKIKIDRYTFPCSFLKNYFRYQNDHPSTPENQIQASAVSRGCDWCPNFDASNYKKIGDRDEIRDVFS
jgi:hypothetical protein